VAYAPSLMRHPAAIGDFLKRQLEYPTTSVEFIKQLADLEGTIAKTQGYSAATSFGRGVESGAGSALAPLATPPERPRPGQSPRAAMRGGMPNVGRGSGALSQVFGR
jgi:hypothetical protein